MDFIKQFRAARAAAVPLIAIRTPDPASTIRAIATNLNGKTTSTAILGWDIVHGITGLNDLGRQVASLNVEGEPAMTTARPSDALVLAEKLQVPDNQTDVLLFMNNMHRFWNDETTVQAIWNLREAFRPRGFILIMLTTQGAVLPVELAEDVLIIDEALPDADELARIVKDCFDAAELKPPAEEVLTKAIDAVIGLAAFPAEQTVAMCMSSKGLNVAEVWERKRQVIEQTPGLAVWRGGETFEAIGGCENAKKFLRALIAGKNAPRVIVFCDEIEKAFAGTGTDLSGVKTELTGTMLTWMQDKKAKGVILIGPPGAAKSVIAKATGNTAGIPTIAFDLAAMQSSLVGSSGERLRAALKIVEAVSQGRALFIATCNRIASLPPELRRRFKRGTFFFDLPTASEREAIWKIYETRYQIEGFDATRPDDMGWTGAEIEQCCETAYELGLTLQEAAAYVVPVSKSAAEEIKNLRMQASGKFISAAQPGIYQYHEESVPTKLRRIRTDADGMTGKGDA